MVLEFTGLPVMFLWHYDIIIFHFIASEMEYLYHHGKDMCYTVYDVGVGSGSVLSMQNLLEYTLKKLWTETKLV